MGDASLPTRKTYLITGANRGLGRGFAAEHLSRPNTTVVAAVRNPKASSSQSLHDLPRTESSHLVVVKYDASSDGDAKAVASYLASHANITSLDVVIANAGIADVLPTVANAKASDMLQHFTVNVVAVALLFGALQPFLQKSSQQHDTPKLITISSSAGSISRMESLNFPNAVYGTSKAALNYITKKIHLENPEIIAFPLDPGWVQTDMGNSGARSLGLKKAETPVEESVAGMIRVVDGATKEDTSGKFWTFRGECVAW